MQRTNNGKSSSLSKEAAKKEDQGKPDRSERLSAKAALAL
jgi:hypothetical protein